MTLLRGMPKASIPVDLIASIEAATLLRQAWWESETFRLRWLPAFLGLATALGALWLCGIQRHPARAALLEVPVAARPLPRPEIVHALLPHTESSNPEKGESRENQKS